MRDGFFLILCLLLERVVLSFTFTTSSGSPSFRGNTRYHHELNGISKSQVAVLDGSSFNALDAFLTAEGKQSSNMDSTSRHGYCSVIVVRKSNNERVVAMRIVQNGDYDDDHLEKVTIDDNIEVYKDSIATIPKSISDEDAISTCIASLVGIHCALYDPVCPDNTIVRNVGGSTETFISSDEVEEEMENKKAVVVGGGDYAAFVADGLSSVGASVTQVTTNKLVRPRKQSKVTISPPEVGELSLGFASALGKFDILVDTLSDESRAGESMCIGIDNEWDDFSTKHDEECSSAVILELKKRHNCKRYISTMCKAQQMVRDNGLIFGRNEAVNYIKNIGDKPIVNKILPPKHFGTRTLQKLFDSNIILKSKDSKTVWNQGWSMKDYWELTTWPRDTAGAANVRFGFPVIDDVSIDNDDELYEEAAPPLSTSTPKSPKLPKDEFAGKNNPFILNINSIEDLSSDILGEKKKCVLFLSSTSCRTCKYLMPQYTKISRDSGDSEVLFAKANAFTKEGKKLSKLLQVDAVPAFVLFRDGMTFGKTLSLTRLPSKKLDMALEFLDDGEWDAKKINKLSK